MGKTNSDIGRAMHSFKQAHNRSMSTIVFKGEYGEASVAVGYSYRTPVAAKIEMPDGTSYVLLTVHKYSITTSTNHMPHYRRCSASDLVLPANQTLLQNIANGLDPHRAIATAMRMECERVAEGWRKGAYTYKPSGRGDVYWTGTSPTQCIEKQGSRWVRTFADSVEVIAEHRTLREAKQAVFVSDVLNGESHDARDIARKGITLNTQTGAVQHNSYGITVGTTWGKAAEAVTA